MDKFEKLYEIIKDNNMSEEDVANLFVDYFGGQILNEDFFDFIENEGYYVGE